ncbi:hypothetical protein BN59_00232 [Legionella massiliensis]|uniref:Uncharacterized protein n=1 Tax=Legionella massiliensis TaxID=1034943 RepID=A0A078KW42_9GAMM|nr:hypothetical protein [Legionella massiliensis]CDZ75969.1 hypothetical protein BN59_00232 [Legionella massiliensis]CEE11707.1 hypothetical protein BN1094_00232 [Legionella massiliensis]
MKAPIMVIALLCSGLATAQTLDTQHFTIAINCQSPEYEVGCDKASYQGTNKATGGTINLMGRQIMQMCADGVTPCHSLGYQFTNGKIIYFVSEDGHLLVTDGAKVLVDESGTWQF